ncbi:MAG TPA: M1 family metallopeptidase [Flavobacterium sp.]|uniref:M1 family metallopeptidase n=1 Tax=Flavobacterium sp. TaxID=239 RepID=UPI001B47D14E|nr:M1 family metallopeptidase [Flavobacterium sp.]MBP7183838.1 M1 family metallopeptidase [Flavobacterium sp.]MBP7318846.1 M1 family metallopeptidase [Flavobacterium sp.]MBP8886153.1 M1 family metallopeptidase [Flavobacterium sp.]HRL71387.1 M1 family metallopeptidase [Flavobacterium sp.]
MKRQLNIIFFLFLLFNGVKAQGLLQQKVEVFTRQDSLRGSITKERAWWDVKNYHLDIKVNPVDSTITGSNTIGYKVLQEYKLMQIDLQNPMEIYKVIQDGKELKYKREGNAFFIELIAPQRTGTTKELTVFYGGKPKVAINPPWDGGISWEKDSNRKLFIASSCQGLGASVWWPNKDHMYDEVENMRISINAPKNLIAVSNGRLQSVKQMKDGTKTYNWYVSNPINNYGVNINIGDYVSFSEKFKGEKGDLDCTYYVLKDNLAKAKKQFQDVPKMLKAFEYWFGPYPFYEDSYKLVEAPYLGMEHQSSITYGNGFQNGYRGRDLSGTGWGLKFDFIIIHESGHEWFANSITNKDIADMWIHESFTNYSESLFVEYYYGKEAGFEYVRGTRKGIDNDKPIIGHYDVNSEGSSDMYPKGGNMLHTLRQIVNNDEKWREILRGLNSTFYHQTVTTKQIEDYLSNATGVNLTAFFNQYLRDTRIPTLEYFFKKGFINFRWTNCVSGFDMPVKVTLNGAEQVLAPKTEWKNIATKTENQKLDVNRNFYVASFNITE